MHWRSRESTFRLRRKIKAFGRLSRNSYGGGVHARRGAAAFGFKPAGVDFRSLSNPHFDELARSNRLQRGKGMRDVRPNVIELI